MCNAKNHPPGCSCGWGRGWQAAGVGSLVTEMAAYRTGASWEKSSAFTLEGLPTALTAEDDINAVGSCGYTALIWAALKGNYATAQFLMSKGANIEGKDTYGQTALYFATINCHYDVAQLLVDQGADSTQRDAALSLLSLEFRRKTEAAVIAAVKKNDRNALISALEEWNDNGRWEFRLADPINLAIKFGYSEMIATLIQSNFHLDVRDESGRPPIMYAAMEGRTDIAKMLFKAGVEVPVSDRSGWTPHQLAKAYNHPEMANWLESIRANDQPLGDGITTESSVIARPVSVGTSSQTLRMRKDGGVYIATSPDGLLEACGETAAEAMVLLREMLACR